MSGRGIGDLLAFFGKAIETGTIPDNGSPMLGPDTCRACHPHERHTGMCPQWSQCLCDAGDAAAAVRTADTVPAPPPAAMRAAPDPTCLRCDGVGERMARGNVIIPCECTARKGA